MVDTDGRMDGHQGQSDGLGEKQSSETWLSQTNCETLLRGQIHKRFFFGLRCLPFCHHSPTSKFSKFRFPVYKIPFFGLLNFRFCVSLRISRIFSSQNRDLLNPVFSFRKLFSQFRFRYLDFFPPSIPPSSTCSHTHHAATHITPTTCDFCPVL